MAAFKGFQWIVLTTIFGTLQISFLLLLRYVKGLDLEPIINSLIKEGAFLFFSTGMVVGLSIDYQFSKTKSRTPKREWQKFYEGFIYLFMPSVIVIFTLAFYLLAYDNFEGKKDFFYRSQIWCFVASIAVSLASKIHLLRFEN
jgi:F0F1-type ATP synthase membrane subunit c/vacuolar-type H+-ATPase subunit K